MEEKTNQQDDIVLNNVFTLAPSAKHMTRFDSKDRYLFKNGGLCRCPFLSTIGIDTRTGNYGMMEAPCGTPCHHFHIYPETKKVLVPESEGSEKKVEKIIKTRRLKVALTCGNNAAVYSIANLKTNESPADNNDNGNLKVTKTENNPQ